MTAPVHAVGVIGAGTMGVGIAYVFAHAGCEVTLVEPNNERATAALTAIESRARKMDVENRLLTQSAAQIRGRVSLAESVEAMPIGLDLIIEAVPEDFELKVSVLAAAERRGPAILATNTSALSVSTMAAVLLQPESLVGLHFFNPVWSMPLLEVVRGSANSDALVATARSIGDLIGKETIVVRDCPGFVTSRLGVALGLEAIRMLEHGVAAAEDIDRAMVSGYRHPMGPLRLTDLVGLDVRLHIAEHLCQTLGPRFAPPQLLFDKVAAGELGKKSSRGFYDWTNA